MADDPNNDWKNNKSTILDWLKKKGHPFIRLSDDTLENIADFSRNKVLTPDFVEKEWGIVKSDYLKSLRKSVDFKNHDELDHYSLYNDLLRHTPVWELYERRDPIFMEFLRQLKRKFNIENVIQYYEDTLERIRNMVFEKHGGMRHQFQKAPRRTF